MTDELSLVLFFSSCGWKILLWEKKNKCWEQRGELTAAGRTKQAGESGTLTELCSHQGARGHIFNFFVYQKTFTVLK